MNSGFPFAALNKEQILHTLYWVISEGNWLDLMLLKGITVKGAKYKYMGDFSDFMCVHVGRGFKTTYRFLFFLSTVMYFIVVCRLDFQEI